MYEIKLYNILKNKMRVVFFCENLYAIDILLPIHKEALSISDNASLLWYVHAPRIAQFPLKDEVNYTTAYFGDTHPAISVISTQCFY